MGQLTLSQRPYVNSNLFSGHYLDERLTEREEWDCDDAARETLEHLQELYSHEGELVEAYDEDPLIDNWIGEVLDILGFGTQSETTLPDGGGHVDLLLFEDEATRREAANTYLKTEETTDLFAQGQGLLEAKQWDADFTSRFSEHRPYRNASHQIKHYLERTPENIQWGILTNGRKWRLYGTKDYETQTYYEVDLPDLIERGDLEAFKYFYMFFRPAAFVETAGTTFLEDVWSESETAAQQLGEDLQDNVFTALRILGRGFMETNDLAIGPEDDDDLEELKQQSLVLLYRLMFVLYAESRGLIHPEGQEAETEFRENFSLDRLRGEIHDTIGEVDEGFATEYSEHSTTMWSQLEDLFRLIDQGEASLGIPPYNGGLFDHDTHEFLTNHQVSNRYLTEVIYRISTTENEDGRYVPADYADLDTRHLGSIYEGLLEHQFSIAPEDYAAVTEDDGQVWKFAEEVTVAEAVETVSRGDLYVVNDQGERKTTGAYYTPDYVVTYIVEETVGPLVEEIREDLIDQGFEPGTQEYLGPFLQRVTGLKILDPAMGSGHFLTRATGFLAEEVMNEVREVEAELGVAFDEGHVKREIAKECIYGVDVNGMAVELAKLSMWLETLAADRPLAFLDHHLKEGNSLVGSDVTAVLSNGAADGDGQLTLQQSFARVREATLDHVMDLMEDLLAIDNETLEDIKSMEEIYDDIRADPLYQRLFELTNVHTASEFGEDVPSTAYAEMARAIENDEEWFRVSQQDWFNTAQAAADEELFFHWELEYPEVFFDEDGGKRTDAGFDAVIGNPPYVRQELITSLKEYFKRDYSVYHGRADIYAYFVEQALELTRDGGHFSYILSHKFVKVKSGSELRELVGKYQIKEFIDFQDLPVFGLEVSAYPAIMVLSKTEPKESFKYAKIDGLDFASLPERIEQKQKWVDQSYLSDEEWTFLGQAERKLKERVVKAGRPVGDVIGDPLVGVKTGLNDVLIIDEDKIIELFGNTENIELFRPVVFGKEIKRFNPPNPESYIMYPYVETNEGLKVADLDKYEVTANYLEQHKEELVDRAIIKDKYPDGEMEWYELQQLNENVDQSEEKIIYPDISRRAHYTIDTKGGVVDMTGFILQSADRYHLGLLNSSLLEWILAVECAKARGGYLRPKAQYVKNLPIKEISQSERVYDSSGTSEQELAGQIENLSEELLELNEELDSLNLDLLDYISGYEDGPTLGEIYFPAEGVSNSILTDTTEDRDSLRLGSVELRENGNRLALLASARFKPKEPEDFDTDQWGYTETELIPAMEFADLSGIERALLSDFIPIAAEEAGGFAGFRETATSTNSLIDRLESLTLPNISTCRTGLERYIEVKTRSEEIKARIQEAEERIDDLVFTLYEISADERELIEEALTSLIEE